MRGRGPRGPRPEWTERRCTACRHTKSREEFPTRGGYRCRRCENRRRRKYPENEGKPGSGAHTPGCQCRFCGHTHGQPSGEDILALAETTLFPSVPYERMTKDQRDVCIAWAKDYLIRSGKWPTKKERERAA